MRGAYQGWQAHEETALWTRRGSVPREAQGLEEIQRLGRIFDGGGEPGKPRLPAARLTPPGEECSDGWLSVAVNQDSIPTLSDVQASRHIRPVVVESGRQNIEGIQAPGSRLDPMTISGPEGAEGLDAPKSEGHVRPSRRRRDVPTRTNVLRPRNCLPQEEGERNTEYLRAGY